jgi:DNA-binding response OmpR family regulator
MELAFHRILLIYETEPPGPLLVARLSPYDVDLVPSQKLDPRLRPPNLRGYKAILVYTPVNLRRGRELCDRLRPHSAAPILLIAPVVPADEACLVLEESAHVLLAPDVDPAIVAGHIAALLRCRQAYPAAQREPVVAALGVYRDEVLEIDLVRNSVVVDGQPVHMTRTEFRFLSLLVRHAGELLSYDEILSNVWGWEATDHRIVHTLAAQLRAKLGERGAKYLVTEYGSGYRFSTAGT